MGERQHHGLADGAGRRLPGRRNVDESHLTDTNRKSMRDGFWETKDHEEGVRAKGLPHPSSPNKSGTKLL
ncbi:hypothetical protein OPV22_006581 [Ensete ventricosum]|uniref:Uncharacterized protein n=1 Tax=Ensete ventricosum TaxID=4639 RepID=A0AAV8RTI0_ENSVE|nr:hypothetical protein OPV22_006581 [Ensete ventricosum]